MNFPVEYVNIDKSLNACDDTSQDDSLFTQTDFTPSQLILHVQLSKSNTNCYVIYDWYRGAYLLRFKYDDYTAAADYFCKTAKQATAFIKIFSMHEEAIIQLCSCAKVPYDVYDFTYAQIEEDDECYCYGKQVVSTKQSCLTKFIKVLSTVYN